MLGNAAESKAPSGGFETFGRMAAQPAAPALAPALLAAAGDGSSVASSPRGGTPSVSDEPQQPASTTAHAIHALPMSTCAARLCLVVPEPSPQAYEARSAPPTA